MENSKIEWTEHTANLWWGCMKVHTGCKNCYAETWDKRFAGENPHWGPGSSRKVVLSVWKDLNKFQKVAAKAGEIHRVFVGSMMDIFEDPLPVVNDKNNPVRLDDPGSQMYTCDLRDTLFGNISRGQYPNLIFLLLTKRPENINKYIPKSWLTGAPENVMFGTSVVNQETADNAIPYLLNVKGKRFLSCEPMVGPVDLTRIDGNKTDTEYCMVNVLNGSHTDMARPCPDAPTIDWVICGGESGDKARPMHPNWARKLRDQCGFAGIPYFFKQWGEWLPFYDRDVQDPDWRNIPKETKSVTRINLAGGRGFHGDRLIYFKRVGKAEAGSQLDGREYKDFIEIKEPGLCANL